VFTCVFTGVSLQLCVRVAYMLTLCAWVGVPYACVHVLLCVCMSARARVCVCVCACAALVNCMPAGIHHLLACVQMNDCVRVNVWILTCTRAHEGGCA